MDSFSEIDFGSFLVYPTKGQSEDSKRIKSICLTVKNDGNLVTKDQKRFRAIPAFIHRLLEDSKDGPLKGFFDDNPILVPMPRSAPVPKGGLIPARTISEEMVRAGLGSKVFSVLTRTAPVPKASQAKSYDERPTIQQHLDSMTVEEDLLNSITSKPIVVVDDFVHPGNQLHRRCYDVKEGFPSSRGQGICCCSCPKRRRGGGHTFHRPVSGNH